MNPAYNQKRGIFPPLPIIAPPLPTAFSAGQRAAPKGQRRLVVGS